MIKMKFTILFPFTLMILYYLSENEVNASDGTHDTQLSSAPKIDILSDFFEHIIENVGGEQEIYKSTILQSNRDLNQTCLNLEIINLHPTNLESIDLPFLFPYYGHNVSKILVNPDGFVAVEPIEILQYIAPLMTNLTSSKNDSIKYCMDKNFITVAWDEVFFEPKPNVGLLSFSLSLHINGTIEFTYYTLPIPIKEIRKIYAYTKIGMSGLTGTTDFKTDLQFEKFVQLHITHINDTKIRSSTIVHLQPLIKCSQITDCEMCLSGAMKCFWWTLENGGKCDKKRSDEKSFNHLKKCPGKIHREALLHDSLALRSLLTTCFLIAFVVMLVLFLWFYYAYTHPSSSSGLCLIQFTRPSTFKRSDETTMQYPEQFIK